MAERITGTPDEPWSVERLGAELKSYIGRLGHLWVEGEITQWSNSRGNVFGKLKDVSGDSTVAFNVWSSTLSRMEGEFSQGDRVVALVKPDYWPRGGTLSMVTAQLRHVGIGDLLARLEALRRSLAAEGLFDAARKRPLPFLPGVVGLITGRDSDAEKDVLRNAQLRWPGVRFRVEHAAVQGDQTVPTVLAALARLEADPEVDVIVIARGGGDFQNLLGFSDESLVRAVAAATTPVVSAIGHENDRPLLDDVADLRASTPTDAAKRVVPDVAEELSRIAQARAMLRARVTQHVAREAERLESFRSRPALARPETMIESRADDLARLTARADELAGRVVELGGQQLGHLRQTLRALSPQSTLDRGYAVVQAEGGSVLRAADAARPGDRLLVTVASGSLDASVVAVRPDDAATA
ncbi:exodeoxyribonuclease VII large subunit [Agrococcus sp. SCSIO52902]|uniref:exodeoxyribonuclease VII large subunit n=1 Tax=Agrococcus sp. SCSIO52902 TaxID=2933290 RepID=UPI001FF608D0|nr:exodeoxyribonuclease VII large subunit [Agrococcus sp. SCSIO52902]UOV99944.1 exodeoxyribonuclease VII large subunit [Agrococcus sp. SCSIO52902]